jgi:predicted membrane metal-binding protein
MKPSSKILLTFLGVLAISFALFTFYTRFTAQRKALYYQFNGKVDTVDYSKKGQPTITIHGIKYDLSVTRWNFDRQIEAGDSMVKKMDSMMIKIFKTDGTVIIKQ